ncbi:helix-turn-helix domain-containing protein [Caldalkalibacillus horti]|uniref:Uncharacterized protein YpbB n=1 Tax=Caldalkalibacillus horti TaxID=77523 RepID=A0ABT9W4K9_9BACI|nr:helix-turn-helix domain-containing protein [Bacillus horti]MDQ0168177.1 uncharacterized protein YpbB [Bacillus horti]
MDVNRGMNGIHIILLHMLQRMNGERTVSGCYHILKGKKSGQAIQDAALYGYKSWFGMLPRLTEHEWHAIVKDSIKRGYIQKVERIEDSPEVSYSASSQKKKEFYDITPAGESLLAHAVSKFQISQRAFYLEDSLLGYQEVILFWKKLQLLTQVLSHYLYNSQHYTPIIEDITIQQWFKAYWSGIKDKETYANELLAEINILLGEMEDELIPELLVQRLTGFQVAGQTLYQLEKKWGIPEALLHVFHYQGVGRLYKEILRNKKLIKLTPLCQSKGTEQIRLTVSTRKTYELLKRKMTLEQIAKKRGLKLSTIEDHLVEIAIYDPDMDISYFLPLPLRRKINQTSQTLQSKKLSDIKNYLDEDASYLQIRLALLTGSAYKGGELA